MPKRSQLTVGLSLFFITALIGSLFWWKSLDISAQADTAPSNRPPTNLKPPLTGPPKMIDGNPPQLVMPVLTADYRPSVGFSPNCVVIAPNLRPAPYDRVSGFVCANLNIYVTAARHNVPLDGAEATLTPAESFVSLISSWLKQVANFDGPWPTYTATTDFKGLASFKQVAIGLVIDCLATNRWVCDPDIGQRFAIPYQLTITYHGLDGAAEYSSDWLIEPSLQDAGKVLEMNVKFDLQPADQVELCRRRPYPVTLTGRLVNGKDEPVTNALIMVGHIDNPSGLTDDKGSFAIQNVWAGYLYGLNVIKSDGTIVEPEPDLVEVDCLIPEVSLKLP